MKSYTATKTLPTTSRVELINITEFAKAILHKNSESFIVHVATLKVISIHLFQVAQLAILQSDKPLTKISTQYIDYANIFY